MLTAAAVPAPPAPAGNILDNTELISTLEQAKAKAVDIADKLVASRVTAVEIDEARVRYTPIAARGAALFFVMSGLAAVSNMYEYSLSAFLHVFNSSLAHAKKDSNLEARLRHVVEQLTYDVYCYTCLGLFERHKLMLSFQMASRVLDTPLDAQLLGFFLKGNLSLEKPARKKACAWLPDSGWHVSLTG